MAIYSKNRMGRMSTSLIEADARYKCTDLGLVLYESCVNDMNIFERLIASDVNEINGLREGTILESEIKALNEKTFKEWLDVALQKIRALIAKIKGWVKDAANKIASYCMTNGKKFIKDYEKVAEKCTNKSSIKITGYKPNVTLTDFKNNRPEFTVKSVKDYIDKLAEKDTEYDRRAVVYDTLQKCVSTVKGVDSAKAFKDALRIDALGKEEKEISANDSIIDTMKEYLKNPKDAIKAIKKIEVDMTGEANKAVDVIKTAYSKSEAFASRSMTFISAVAEIASVYTSAHISVLRDIIVQSRKNLGALKAAMAKTVNESAIEDEDPTLSAAIDLEPLNDDIGEDDIEPEVQEVIDSAEEECAKC